MEAVGFFDFFTYMMLSITRTERQAVIPPMTNEEKLLGLRANLHPVCTVPFFYPFLSTVHDSFMTLDTTNSDVFPYSLVSRVLDSRDLCNLSRVI